MTDDIKPPTPSSRRFVILVVGFGVGVGLGLAPYLGLVDIPGFRPLLSLYPTALRNIIIPLSAFLMGIVAVWVEWLGTQQNSNQWLQATFKRALIILLSGFVVLIVMHTAFVVSVPVDDGKKSVSFVIGLSRQPYCPCKLIDSDTQCIEKLTFNPASIDACWGDRSVRFSRLGLILSYLLTTGGFGALVGLIMIGPAVRHSPRSR